MFISLADFAHYVGPQELADIVSGRIGADIDGAILLGVLKQVEPAATGTLRDAVERIKLALSSADKLAQAYISVRYTQGLSEQDVLSSPLPKIVSIIAKHDLMLTTDEDTRYQYGKALE